MNAMENYNLVELYRRFSNDVYSAWWRGSPEKDQDLQQEFREWLENQFRRDGGVTSYHYTAYEQDAIPTLKRIWEEVKENG